MHLRLLLPILCCLALQARDEGAQEILTGRVALGDWRIHFGIAEELHRLVLRDIDHGGTTTSKETRDFDRLIGASAGIERLWSASGSSGLGWVHGFGFAAGLHRGKDNGEEAEAQQASLTWRGGLLMRWHNPDSIAALRALRFELTPMVGAGMIRIDLEDNDESGDGVILRYGVLFESVVDWRSGWTITGGLGWQGGYAWVDWDNTDGSTAELRGFTARLGTGLRF